MERLARHRGYTITAPIEELIESAERRLTTRLTGKALKARHQEVGWPMESRSDPRDNSFLTRRRFAVGSVSSMPGSLASIELVRAFVFRPSALLKAVLHQLPALINFGRGYHLPAIALAKSGFRAFDYRAAKKDFRSGRRRR
jgi:hypothetical protein